MRTKPLKDITILRENLLAIDLSPYTNLVPAEYQFFFFGRPGEAPYRLLAYLSTLFVGKTLVEIGVHNGWGSLALSYNPTNTIIGYDIDLSTLDERIKNLDPARMTFKEGLAHELDPKTILNAAMIHFDALHDGVYERVFFDFLVDNAYEGVLILDDIHLNPAMQSFWDFIPLLKYDLTEFGHETGTGVVVF